MTEHLEWTIGQVRVTRIEESILPVPWALLVPAGAELLDANRSWMDPFVSASGGRLLLSVHSFVVQTPQTLIVVDTCVGDTGEYQMPGDPAFGERLDAALPNGLPGVDVVVCTHLHFDHVGWNTVEVDGELEPRFANATYLVSEAELAAERDEEDTASFERSVAPLVAAGCLRAVPAEHQIDQWVSLEPSHGHTPGHVSLRITDGDEIALITGDMVHTPLQFAHTDAQSTADNDPIMATSTRDRYVAELADTDILVLGSHFAPPTAGHLVSDPSGIRFE